MKKYAVILITVALAAGGCMEPKSPKLVTLPEGYQVVAEGRPPIGFYMAEQGQVIVTDVSARSTVYSMESKDEGGAIIKVEDDKLIAQLPSGETAGESMTILSGLDAEHSYRIVFRPARATATTMPSTRPMTEQSK